MSLTAEPIEAPASSSPPSSLPDPGERGKLTIHPQVLRKVAQHAADSVAGTVRVRRGVGRGERGTTAKIDDHGTSVDVTLDVALHYPASVPDVVADLRRTVAHDVEHLTSRRVRILDVVVTALVADTPPRVR